MSENSNIEWTDHTFNPWIGCSKVSPGCDHCYAETWAKRYGSVEWGSGNPRKRTSEANWKKVYAWQNNYSWFFADHNRRQRVFCASLADVFDNEVPVEWRNDLWALIKNTPNLNWLLLTKRIGNVTKMLPADWGDGWPNVWLGASIVNQEEADRDITKLLLVPARVRFLSMEPLLGNVDLRLDSDRWVYCNVPEYGGSGTELVPTFNGLHWVITGGESGKGARPMHPAWARSIRDQCVAAGMPFLYKQWGEWTPGAANGFTQWPEIDPSRPLLMPSRPGEHGVDEHQVMIRVGKKAAGRLLDGREWNEFPEAA